MRLASPLLPPLLTLLLATGCGVPVVKGDTGDTSETDVPVDLTDSDSDTITDTDEGELDTDGDGTPDYLDTDSDNDGIPDSTEAGDADLTTAASDSDADGSPDFRDPDSDNNCVEDGVEGGGAAPVDSDGDGTTDPYDADNDGDGIADEDEIGSSCYPVDTDGDGTPDYLDDDSDADGISDTIEGGGGEDPVDTDDDGLADYLDPDSDGDGTTDTEESGGDEDPRDTDEDGIPDYADADSDGDGLLDVDEAGYGTDAYDSDSDSDGYSDGGEVAAGSDPTESYSTPGDGYIELAEGATETMILELTLEGSRTDIVFLLDTTCSASGTLNALNDRFYDIVDALSEDISDAQYAFATYDDYAYGSYGSAGYDLPFILQKQITNDVIEVATAIDATNVHSGGDAAEAGMEALYQTLTGEGYDMGCDGEYDEDYDVQPFKASPSDPFGATGGQAYDPSDDSTGDYGGVGFRDYALPVIVYITDGYLRDPDASGWYSYTPGGCPMDAGSDDVTAAAEELGATLIGVAVSLGGYYGAYAADQMEDLSDATGSVNEDGDPLVIEWNNSDEDALEEELVEAISGLSGGIGYTSVSLVAVDDAYGFISSISPESAEVGPEDLGDTLDFSLRLSSPVPATSEDQIFTISVAFVADGSVILETREIVIVVPGV